MAHLFISVSLLLLWAWPVQAQFTAVQRQEQNDTNFTFTAAPTSGNIVVICGRWEGATGVNNMAIAQGGNTFTMLTRVDNASGDHHSQCGYFIGVSTTNDFGLTYPGSSVLSEATGIEIDPTTGSPTFDTSTNNNAASGTALTSGNITLNATASHWMVVAFGSSYSSGQSISARTINGVAADGFVNSSAAYATLFDRAVTASFTGGAAATFSVSDAWSMHILAFKEGTGGATPVRRKPIVY